MLMVIASFIWKKNLYKWICLYPIFFVSQDIYSVI